MSKGRRIFWRRCRWHVPLVVEAHPFELALGFVLLLNALRTVATTQTTPAVQALPDAPIVAITLTGLVGGIAMLTGLIARSKLIGPTIERAGLLLACASYWAYSSILLLSSLPLSMIWANVTTTTGIGLACLIRERSVRKTQLAILYALRKANTDGDLIRHLIDSRAVLRHDDEEDGAADGRA